MPISKFSLKRSITSYSKVRILISKLIRGNKFFINFKKIKNKVLLNVGCGPFPKTEFINLDYGWSPQINICWDIIKKSYPLPSNSLEGIFSEHCLEHITIKKCLENLKEFHRLLKPNGTVRIVVPDGELYCDLYQKKKVDASILMPYGKDEATGMISINRIFRSHGHQFIYDFITLKLLLKEAGFTKVRQEKFGVGIDKRLLIDREERAIESLYVEAIK